MTHTPSPSRDQQHRGRSGSDISASIAIESEYGWRCGKHADCEVWIKGYGKGLDTAGLARKLAGPAQKEAFDKLADIMLGIGGHFAVAARGRGWTFAAADRVRSIPVAYAKGAQGWVVDDQAERLRSGLGLKKVDPDAALALAMAGYTIDNAVLFAGVEQLGPGEFVLIAADGSARRHRYYSYRPWRSDKPGYEPRKAGKRLADTVLDLIDAMMKDIGDRPLVVPLSAGRDSRLIVSAASHLGYRNVRTFAYGREGSHEAEASRAIAERLGYDWRFVPVSTATMRDYFASDSWEGYRRFADSLQSVPFVQDMPQVEALKRSGYIPDDAVLCNGNSGDYISGNHIVAPMDRILPGLSKAERIARISNTLVSKHFALWRALFSPQNREAIQRQLEASIVRIGASLGDPKDDYGIYESAEFQDRQCKYVISGQRIYEFLGHDWRLPLWDRALLDFFEAVPLEGKIGQKLYVETLEEQDWGGVWKSIPVNAKTIRPHWIRPVRFLARAAHIPFGADAWHDFERRFFQYWMELGGQSAIRTYRDVAGDKRGARHGVAWLTESYLAFHGLAFDGTAAVSHA